LVFYVHFLHFKAIWYILWPFGAFCGHLGIFCGHLGIFCGHLGIFCGHLVYFSILVCCTKKNLATLLEVDLKEALGILHDSTKFD
jgi:hypothetical protein